MHQTQSALDNACTASRFPTGASCPSTISACRKSVANDETDRSNNSHIRESITRGEQEVLAQKGQLFPQLVFHLEAVQVRGIVNPRTTSSRKEHGGAVAYRAVRS